MRRRVSSAFLYSMRFLVCRLEFDLWKKFWTAPSKRGKQNFRKSIRKMTRNVLKIRMQKSVLRGRNRRVESLGLFGRLFVSRSSTKTRLCGVPLSLIPARRFGTAGASPTILGAKGNGSFISATQILKCQRLPFSAVRFFYRYRPRIR